jgi:hypothetical protein
VRSLRFLLLGLFLVCASSIRLHAQTTNCVYHSNNTDWCINVHVSYYTGANEPGIYVDLCGDQYCTDVVATAVTNGSGNVYFQPGYPTTWYIKAFPAGNSYMSPTEYNTTQDPKPNYMWYIDFTMYPNP